MTDDDRLHGRELDLSALRALAHPLRVRIMHELDSFGPLTSSGLAERIGESSGSMSYHLRQLAKHDIITEVEGRGSARERWWKMSEGDLKLGSAAIRDDPAGREATDIISREWHAETERQLDAFSRYGHEILGTEWETAATITTASFRVTREELRLLGDEFLRFLSSMEERFNVNDKSRAAPGALPVQVQFNAFPLVDLVPSAKATRTGQPPQTPHTDTKDAS